ncbi:hypothetical protein Purlil1_6774 [Purpureocillium lilacinum]|uniref:Major facilitator superfamily (MFS) profile domain-containing protein n=1 Tax=Purpureocillium lilacinum TaxID=33203 RepID=A0ABR0BYQ6_PURLI|nr:hypothetical protein Purlil1_6774 [Purpureocillium lilacinum]
MLETSDFVVGASACPDLHVLAPVRSRNASLDHLTPQVDNDTNGMMVPHSNRLRITMAEQTSGALTWYASLAAACFSMGSIFWGYDIGILSTVFVAPGFKDALHHPSSSETGLITAIFAVGGWLSYAALAGPVNDRLGRRWAGVAGVAVLSLGAALQAGAVHLAMMIVGRFIAGVGTSVVSTAVPLYLSEISPARHRGAILALNQTGIAFGIAIAFWTGYGYSFWNTKRGVELEWRLSIVMQFIPALVFCIGAPFLHESPRWLLEHDLDEAAVKSLSALRGRDNVEEVQSELEEIRSSILWNRENSITNAKVFVTNKALWARLWRAWALQFLQQMSGAGGIRYYLPTNFRAAGASESISLLASGIDGTFTAFCVILAFFLVDRIGRRHSLGIGAIIMAFSLMINGALQTIYPDGSNTAASYTCIFFIFFFSLGYSIGFGPTAWTYAAEVYSNAPTTQAHASIRVSTLTEWQIFPVHVRAKGLGIAASGGSLGSIIVTQVWPVAVANIGPKTFFVFMTFNLFSIVLVYTMYPETKGLTLEEIDSHFGNSNLHAESGTGPKARLDEKHEVENVEIEASHRA